MSQHAGRRSHAVIFIAVALIVGVLVPAICAEAATPWEFFREGMAGADSVSKRLWIIFFTLVMLWLSLGALRMLLPILLIAFAVLAARKPQVRRSRFVQIGFAFLLVGILPLTLAGILGADNPIGLALLFAALTPIGLLGIAAGTVLALVKARA